MVRFVLLVLLAIFVFLVVPIWGIASFLKWLKTPISQRSAQRGGSGGGGLGPFMIGVDKLIRPSQEFRVEAENPVVKEDEQDGE